MEYIARILFFTLTVIFQTVLSISSNFFLKLSGCENIGGCASSQATVRT